MVEFKLPDLGEGMQEAEIRRWLVQPGDVIKIDQPMVEVETDKAVIEIPSPVAGTVVEICVPSGEQATVGDVLVRLSSGLDQSTAFAPVPAAPVIAAKPAELEKHEAASMQRADISHTRVLASPAVRKRAGELGINLEHVASDQPDGRITMEGLLAFVAEHAEATPLATQATPSVNGAHTLATTSQSASLEERVPLTGLRRSIAEHMERAWRTIPHATTFDEVDGTELVTLRQLLKPLAEQRGVRLTYVPIVLKLLLPVLHDFPMFNASFDEARREIIYKHVYHMGIATDTPEGLLVPVLRDADQYTLLQMAQQVERLVAGAQKRTLAPAELTGSTFTFNNIGSFGGNTGMPIINAPEAAILAIGRLQERAVVRDGALVVRKTLPLTLTFDHRLIDGAIAGRFLARLKALLEQPQLLMLDMR